MARISVSIRVTSRKPKIMHFLRLERGRRVFAQGVRVVGIAVRHFPDAVVGRRLRQDAVEIIDQFLVGRINAVLHCHVHACV